jgi:hypothetical protein
MKTETSAKIQAMLRKDTPANYPCWEAAEESIMSDLNESEQDEYTNSGSALIEEWFTANDDEAEEEAPKMSAKQLAHMKAANAFWRSFATAA